MRYRIILAMAIVFFSFSFNQLHASSLSDFSIFYEQHTGLDAFRIRNREINPRDSFQDLRPADNSLCSPVLLQSKETFPKKLSSYQPTLLSTKSSPLMAKTPAFLPAPSKPAKNGNINTQVKNIAFEHLNAPYRRGGSLLTGRSTDCSGFVRSIYQKFQIELPHSSVQQAQMGKVAAVQMDFSKLEIGDLLFFRRARSINHVGIYMGEGKMIHASSRRGGVIISDLRQPYYNGKFVVAKRLLNSSSSSVKRPNK